MFWIGIVVEVFFSMEFFMLLELVLMLSSVCVDLSVFLFLNFKVVFLLDLLLVFFWVMVGGFLFDVFDVLGCLVVVVDGLIMEIGMLLFLKGLLWLCLFLYVMMMLLMLFGVFFMCLWMGYLLCV